MTPDRRTAARRQLVQLLVQAASRDLITDEAERLESLCAAVAGALQPTREGTLL